MRHTHLTDDALIAACLDGGAEMPACASCAARLRAIRCTLEEVSDAASSAADEVFPPARVARQRMRILQRIEQFGRQGRVLAFPGRVSAGPSMLRPRPLRRWVASAAAAGLVVGLAAGRVVDRFPAFDSSVGLNQSVPLRASSEPLGDEEALREIEAEVLRRGPAALWNADITPDPWEVQ